MASGIPGDAKASSSTQAAKAALAVATLTVGRTALFGMPSSHCLQRFASACRSFGALISMQADETVVQGVGIGGLVRPPHVLDTTADDLEAALLAGLAGGHETGATLQLAEALAAPLAAALTATGAVMTPLEMAGCFDVRGARDPLPVSHADLLPPSAAAAAALAALNAAGLSSFPVAGPLPGCLEALMRDFGVEVVSTPRGAGRHLAITGRPELRPRRIDIAGLVAGSGRPA